MATADKGFDRTVGIEAYTKPLVGLHLSSAEHKDGSGTFAFGNWVSIVTTANWRLIGEDSIIVSSEDHGHRFGLPKPVEAGQSVLSAVMGCAVAAASVSIPSGDLSIWFGGQARLEFLQMSSGYESWTLHAGDSFTVCTGGGKLAHFPGSNHIAVIRECMRFATEGPNFEEPEFHTIFGLYRSEVRAIAASLTESPPWSESTVIAILATLNNLSGYPGGRDHWSEWVSVPWPEASAAFEKWRHDHETAGEEI